MWKITDCYGCSTTIDDLREAYPNLVAFDESGFEVDIDEFLGDPIGFSGAGYVNRVDRRILFWENEEESKDDEGVHAIASAIWDDFKTRQIRSTGFSGGD